MKKIPQLFKDYIQNKSQDQFDTISKEIKNDYYSNINYEWMYGLVKSLEYQDMISFNFTKTIYNNTNDKKAHSFSISVHLKYKDDINIYFNIDNDDPYNTKGIGINNYKNKSCHIILDKWETNDIIVTPERRDFLKAKYSNIISHIEDIYEMTWVDLINYGHV